MRGPILLVAAGAAALPAAADEPSQAAQVERLQHRLLNATSATAVLREWCRERGLAADPQIRALRDAGPAKPLSAADREALGLSAGEEVGYRRVRLACGERVLSEADNWYRPALLTAEMNRVLETTDTPFGAVIAPLGYQRRTLSSRVLPGGEAGVLQHRALLLTTGGEPLSLVVETYTAAMLHR